MAAHCESSRRTVHVVNLDPAAEVFNYPVAIDIRELIQVEDVMEADDLRLGPNGGLVYCMQHLVENLDWLEEQLGEGDDDYFIFDCPGQIELYTHLPIMRQLVEALAQWDFRIAGIFLLDAQFLVDAAKFFSGTLAAMSAMLQVEIPHHNILTKMDMLTKRQKKDVERYLDPDTVGLLSDLHHTANPKFQRLNEALASLLDDYSQVSFLPLDVQDEDSVGDILQAVDMIIQYGEDLDVRVPAEPTEDDDDQS